MRKADDQVSPALETARGRKRGKEMSASQDRIVQLFDQYVPEEGPAPTVAGEIIRAVSYIGWRWINDGDRIQQKWEEELDEGPCNPAAHYLEKHVGELAEEVLSMMRDTDMYDSVVYREHLDTLLDIVLDYLDQHPECFVMPNQEDMWDDRMQAAEE